LPLFFPDIKFVAAFTAHISFYRHPEKYDFDDSFFGDGPGCNASALGTDDVLFVVVLKYGNGHGISTNV
jgi:hypothetical protein